MPKQLSIDGKASIVRTIRFEQWRFELIEWEAKRRKMEFAEYIRFAATVMAGVDEKEVLHDMNSLPPEPPSEYIDSNF
jgi:hypothetical protein